MKFLGKIVITLLALCCWQSMWAQYTEKDIYLYIDTYKELAINKMYEYKIPASITIAQGIFESACGKSHLAVDGNNHFGIKCHTGWNGDTILIDDDALQECFRKYAKVEDSYTDHSEFLKTRKRYESLFTLDVMDYPGWARGLKAAGYATNPQYADRLISIIERYHINRLDTLYQERVNNGYYKDYPNVHPALMVDLSFVDTYANGSKPTPAPSNNVAENKPATNPTQPSVQNAEPEKKQEENKHPKSKFKKPQKVSHKPQSTSGNNPTSPKQEPTKETKPVTPTTNKQPQETATATPAPKEDSHVEKPTRPQPVQEQIHREPPTQLTVFSAFPNEYPTVTDYPFTDRPVYRNNNTFFVIAQKGDTYAKIASDVQTKEKKLKKFNDASGTGKLQVGQVVYVEPKRNVGAEGMYTVENTESMLYISQKCAIKLKKLCQLNGLTEKAELKKGRKLKLK